MLFWITEEQFSMPQGNLIIITDLLTKAHTHLLNLIDRALQRGKLWEGIRQSSRNGGTQETKIKPARCWELGRRWGERKCEGDAEKQSRKLATHKSCGHSDTTVTEFLTSVPITPRTMIQECGEELGRGGWGLERQAPPQARIPPVNEGTRWG